MKTDDLSNDLLKTLGGIFPKVKSDFPRVFGSNETPFNSWLQNQPISANDQVESLLASVFKTWDEGGKPDPVPARVVTGRVDVSKLPPAEPVPVPVPKEQPASPKVAKAPTVVATAEPEEEEDDAGELLRRALTAMGRNAGLNEDRFADLFKHHIENGVRWNDTGVVKLIDERLKGSVQRLEIKTPGGMIKPVSGLMHRQATELATWANADVPVWAWGGAGAGKSTLFYQVAGMLDYDDESARLVSVGPTTTASNLIGFCTAGNGDYKEGLLYRPFKEGWIVGLDEPACGDASVLAQLNAMIANDRYTFPNGETVKRHERFRILCFDNTKGTGATAGYTARTRLDAATMDRFAVIEMKYDEELELAICTGEMPKDRKSWTGGESGEHADLCKRWVKWVQLVRDYVGQSVLVSPRASILGVRAIRAGIPVAEVKEALVFKLVAADTKARIIENVKGI